MAYNVYFACDRCGVMCSWTNFTVNYSCAIKYARSKGWQVGKKGWFCPECKAKMKKGRRTENA